MICPCCFQCCCPSNGNGNITVTCAKSCEHFTSDRVIVKKDEVRTIFLSSTGKGKDGIIIIKNENGSKTIKVILIDADDNSQTSFIEKANSQTIDFENIKQIKIKNTENGTAKFSYEICILK